MSRLSIRAVELHGRLGNQLFQFALMKSLLPDQGPVLVDTVAASDEPLASALRPDQFRRLRPSESLRLRRPPSVGGRSRRNLAGMLRRIPGGGYTGVLGQSIFRETRYGQYDSRVADIEGDILYCGFFQNELYFRHDSKAILDGLLPASVATSAQLRAIEGLGSDRQSVAVVVRAGLDYVRIGWDLPLRWYLDAVQVAAEAVERPSFVVFSDVPLCAEAVASALQHLGPSHAVVGLDPVQQLHVMAHADHAVTASTSFGWWGAWLGDALRGFEPRTVVVPDPWITPGSQTAPERWLRVPARTGVE